MGKALGLLLIAIASGLMIYWLVVPVIMPAATSRTVLPVPVSTSDTQPQSAVVPTAPLTANRPQIPAGIPDRALPPPRTSGQIAYDDLESKRAPYYQWVRDQASDRVSDARSADDDGATLLIYTAYDSPDVVLTVVRDVVAPKAYQYGFRHVRFFVPNPPESVERYRFDAEATYDQDGTWHTFHK